MLTIPQYIRQYYPKFTKFITDFYEFEDSYINFTELLKSESFNQILDSFELNLDQESANKNLLTELGYIDGIVLYYKKPKNVIDTETNIPEFVIDAYPRFVSFIKSYYSFLESDSNFLNIIESFESNINPTEAADYYLNKLLTELGLFDISDAKQLFIKKNLLSKFIREFNSSRGSQESFKILHKLLFNSECKISYPRDKLFSPSSGEFVVKHIVYITTTNIQNSVQAYPTKAFSGNYISSQNKSYTFTTGIEAVSYQIISNVKYAKLEIVKPEIDFLINEKVTVSFDGVLYEETVVPLANFEINSPGYGYKRGDRIYLPTRGNAIVDTVTKGGYDSIEILAPGSGYQVGDVISLSIIPDDKGYGFLAIVSSVSSTKGITSIKIINSGFDYSINEINNSYINIKRKNVAVGSSAQLKLTSTTISGISSIRIIDNYINVGINPPVTISSISGTFADISTKLITNYDEAGYSINNSNTLGQNYIILNSETHLHQHAYSIESTVPINYIDDIIENYLHPAGLVRHHKVTV